MGTATTELVDRKPRVSGKQCGYYWQPGPFVGQPVPRCAQRADCLAGVRRSGNPSAVLPMTAADSPRSGVERKTGRPSLDMFSSYAANTETGLGFADATIILKKGRAPQSSRKAAFAALCSANPSRRSLANRPATQRRGDVFVKTKVSRQKSQIPRYTRPHRRRIVPLSNDVATTPLLAGRLALHLMQINS